MLVQSPLKKTPIRQNLRIVPKPVSETNENHNETGKSNFKTKAGSVKKHVGSIKLKPGKVILVAIILGVAGFFYLTHVFATQALLNEVQALESEFNKARSMHDVLKLQFDRMVGPSEIYQKAEKAGFVNGGPADKVITIDRK